MRDLAGVLPKFMFAIYQGNTSIKEILDAFKNVSGHSGDYRTTFSHGYTQLHKRHEFKTSHNLFAFVLSFIYTKFGYLVKLVTGHFNTIINTRTSFFARAQMCPSLPREVVSPEKKLKVSSAFRVRVPLANNS